MNPTSAKTQATSNGMKLLAAAATASALLAGCETKPKAGREPVPPRVVVAEVRRATLPIVAESSGTTRALQEVTIRARVTGFLKEVRFKEGADVKKGQLLLVIEEEPFQVRLASAKAGLAEAQAALSKAKESKAREMAKAQLALDEAQANLAVVELNRERALYQRKASPLEEVDRKDALQKRSAAQVDYSKSSLQQAVADFDINIASAAAKVTQAESAVRDAEIELGYCRMESPIDGRIGELIVKAGNLVTGQPPTELVTVRQLDPMGFDIRPGSRYLPRITELMEKGITVDLLVQGERAHPHPGRVSFVDNRVDPSTSTVLLKAEVANPDRSLLPGEYVRTRAEVGRYQDALVVPDKAVVEGQDGFAVFVVDDQGTVDRAKVEPLDTVDGMKVLASGVTPGQKVVVEGVQLVRKGAKVKAEVRPFEPKAAAPTEGGARLETNAAPPAKSAPR